MIPIRISDWQKKGSGKKANKYHNKKVTFQGITFSSQFEASVYACLLLRARAGEIEDIKCQPRVKFHTHDHGNISMIPDFSYVDVATGELRYAEAKGFETSTYLRKRKAWRQGGPALLEVYKGSAAKPHIHERIQPLNPCS